MGEHKDIYEAIFAVQQSAEYIKKDKNGQVGAGKFKYADLLSTWESVKQLLKDNKIVVISNPTSSAGSGAAGTYFKMTLRHIDSGTEITEYMMMVLTRQDPQALGAAITFYRRYMLTSMLGLIPDDDNDAREQRLATAQQKMQIVGAVKLTFGDDREWQPQEINQKIEDIIGKHPSQIRESEADNIIELIKSYK